SECRPALLAGAVCERETCAGYGKRHGARSESDRADQPAWTLRVRGQERRYRGAATGYFGSASRQRCGDLERASGRRTRSAGGTGAGSDGKQSACLTERTSDGASTEGCWYIRCE